MPGTTCPLSRSNISSCERKASRFTCSRISNFRRRSRRRITVDPVEAARKLFAGPCDFIWGAQRADNLPPTKLPEIAFVGRSNVGKSSLLNALTGRKSLARVSQTPGATRQINFFDLGGKL